MMIFLVVVIGVIYKILKSFGVFYSEIEVFQQIVELLLIMKCVNT